MASISLSSRALLAAIALLAAPLSQAENAMAYRGSAATALDEAPADVVAVTLSTVALLRGLREPARLRPVTFKPGVAEKLRDPHTRFEGFDLKGFQLSYLGPSTHAKSGRRIVGSLVFADSSDLRSEVSYAIDYALQPQQLLIHEAAVERKSPLRPRVVMYAVPTRRMPADFFQTVRPFGETLGWLAKNSINTTNTATLGSEPHYVFAASLDRLGKQDRLILNEGEKVSQTLLDIGGWQMIVRRVEPTDRPVTTNVSYRAGNRGGTARDIAILTLPAPTTRNAAPRPD